MEKIDILLEKMVEEKSSDNSILFNSNKDQLRQGKSDSEGDISCASSSSSDDCLSSVESD